MQYNGNTGGRHAVHRRTTLAMYIFLCLTLGLAPYNPPHLWEKIVMLKNGTLKRPVDWFDLFMHATPWGLLFLKWTTT